MNRNNIQMVTRVNKNNLLATLKENLAKHQEIVKEARAGYIEQSKKVLLAKLKEIKNSGVVSLQFNLNLPLDYSEVYQTSIAMLEWSNDETVELQADEFRQLVQDKWDWSRTFLLSNASYSKLAGDTIGSNSAFGGSL